MHIVTITLELRGEEEMKDRGNTRPPRINEEIKGKQKQKLG